MNLKLDAKWLLEHQLAQNRARRAREAAETEMASNKRKLETNTDGGVANTQQQQADENPAKRIKVQHSPRDIASPPQQSHKGPVKDAQSLGPAQSAAAVAAETSRSDVLTLEDTTQKGGQPDKKESSPTAVVEDEKKGEVVNPTEDKLAAGPPEKAEKQIEQPDQTANDDDMNFESMFGDVNAGNDQNNDMNFDLDLHPDNLDASNPFGSVAHDASNLELLPGLESYANASGDDFGIPNHPTSAPANQTGIRTLENNFDLPDIQGDSSFNDLFADGDFGGDASLMDLDLEDGFFNT